MYCLGCVRNVAILSPFRSNFRQELASLKDKGKPPPPQQQQQATPQAPKKQAAATLPPIAAKKELPSQSGAKPFPSSAQRSSYYGRDSRKISLDSNNALKQLADTRKGSIRVSNEPPPCRAHGYPATHMCFTCKILICGERCVGLRHANHNMIECLSGWETIQGNAIDYLKVLMDWNSDVRRKHSEIERKMVDAEEELKQSYISTAQRVCREVETWRDDALKVIASQHNYCKNTANDKFIALLDLLEKLIGKNKFIVEKTKFGDPSVLLAIDARDKVDELLQLKTKTAELDSVMDRFIDRTSAKQVTWFKASGPKPLSRHYLC